MSTRKYLLGSIVWGLAGALPLLAGCATDMEQTETQVAGDDGLDAEIEQMLGTAVSGCAANSSPGTTDGFGFTNSTLYLLLGNNGSAVITNAAGKIAVNGNVCVSQGSSTISKIVVSENTGSTGAQKVVLDQLPGAFSATMLGSSGGITLNLGTGTDTVSLRGTSSADSYKAFEGTGSTAFIELNGNTNADVKVVKTGGSVVLQATLGVGNDTFAADSSATSPSTFAGTSIAGTRSVAGTAVISSVKVWGGNGNDTITGSATTNTLYGDLGSDVITGGAVADTIYGGTSTASNNADGNDVISGLAGDDTIYGGNGNDQITGGTGVDSIQGGAGNDTFLATTVDGTDGSDNLDGGTETDTLDYSARTDATAFDFSNGTAGTGVEVDTLTGFEVATGGNGADTFTGASASVTFNGGNGDDTITGSSVADTLNGNNGNDSIIGLAGNDTMAGGEGDDVFFTASSDGADVMNGNNGTDTVDYTGRSAALSLSNDGTSTDGESGENDGIATTIEVLKGGGVADTITGASGDDSIYGGGGADILTGGAGNDYINGGAGADSIFAGDGDDAVSPGFVSNDDDGGNDSMNGGNGNDTIDLTGSNTDMTVYLCTSTTTTTFLSASSQDASEATVQCDGTTGVSGRTDSDVVINFEILDAGAGADTVYGSSGDDVIYGNVGSDVVYGNGGADYIDADGGDAGSGDDICNGGISTNCEL